MTKRSPELAAEICETIASSPLGLTTLCKNNPHWPDFTNIYKWMNADENFRQMYARAKELQIEATVNKMYDMIEDDHHQDLDSNIKIDSGIYRAKMDAIKWLAAKLQPKRYADFQQQSNIVGIHNSVMDHKHELDEKNKKDH